MQPQYTSSRQALKTIINITLDTLHTEKIYLLPTQPSPKQLPIPEQLPSHHLLILTKDPEPYNSHEPQRKVEREYSHIAPIHIILHDIHTFNTHLHEQRYFFPELSQSTAIFDHGRIPLASRAPMNRALMQRSLQQSFSLLFRKSEELLRSAREQQNQGIMNIASLAEAICHMYAAIEIVFTGYHAHTCHLLRLRNSTSRFSPDIALLFPYHSIKEKQMLNRLHRTFLHKLSREKAGMSAPEYEAALQRAHDAQMMALLACQHHINTLS